MIGKPSHSVVLYKDFAGVPAGSRMLISSPMRLAAFLKTQHSAGQTIEVQQLRRELATLHGADAACPVSTAIFLRIVAEAAWEQIEAGKPTCAVAPFWRAVDPKSPLAKKLRAGSDWIAQQRAGEQSGNAD